MVVRQKLTPESFLEAPRRSAAVPNQDGTLAFFTVSTHTFGGDGDGEDGDGDGKTTQDLVIVSLESGNTYTLARGSEIHDAAWVPGDNGGGGGPLLWLESTARGQGDGETRMRVVTPRSTADMEPGSHYVAGVIPAPVQALKLCALEDGSVACAVVARAAPDGSMFNDVTAARKRESTARIYDGWNVREVSSSLGNHSGLCNKRPPPSSLLTKEVVGHIRQVPEIFHLVLQAGQGLPRKMEAGRAVPKRPPRHGPGSP